MNESSSTVINLDLPGDESMMSATATSTALWGLVGAAVALVLLHYHQRRRHSLYGMPYMDHPPEGPELPFLGHAITMLRYRPWDLLTYWHARQGPVVAFGLLGKTMFSLADPALLKCVLQSKISHVKKDIYNTYKSFLVILGRGIVTSEDQSWMHQRLKMSQPLRRDILERIPAQTLRAVQHLMQQMDEAADTRDAVVPLGESLRHLTLQVISGTFLSLSAEESDSTFAQIYMPIVDESNCRVWHPYRSYMFFMPFWWRHLWNVRRLNSYVSGLIRQRWILRRQQQQQEERELDVLDQVLQVYEKECLRDHGALPAYLPKDAVCQFRDEMKTFILAGHETSAAMMTWAFYELMGDPDRLLQPLLQEAATVFNDEKSVDWKEAPIQAIPAADRLAQLQYSEATLKESLRKYSVVPIVGRRIVKDLYVDKYFIPKGSSILINIQSVHWNPQFWPEPKKFDPNRFLEDAPPPYTFLPFIAGPRNCLGQNLALLESKMVLSLLSQRYKLELVGQQVHSTDWSDGRDPRHRFMVPAIPKEELVVRVIRR